MTGPGMAKINLDSSVSQTITQAVLEESVQDQHAGRLRKRRMHDERRCAAILDLCRIQHSGAKRHFNALAV
jgi:hypothetical protein